MLGVFRFLVSVVLSSLCLQSHAEARQQNVYRDFWNPTYHVERLSYCTLDGQQCGMKVANCYCKKMGYMRASKQIIEHNIGLTRFINTKARCQGWKCNGFRLIRCVGNMSHTPPKKYYYRSRLFVYPRIRNYRINWCYADQKGCGQRAAHSFCRIMGYMRVQDYKKQNNVPATLAIGNQELCFGSRCNGFKYIACYR